jgi:hypothetical protein
MSLMCAAEVHICSIAELLKLLFIRCSVMAITVRSHYADPCRSGFDSPLRSCFFIGLNESSSKQ